MRILFFISIFLLALPVYALSGVEITVLKVYDGDSILARIEQSNSTFRIRLIDIDCFEGTYGTRAKYQARKFQKTEDEIVSGGNLAGDYLREALKNKKTYFEFLGIDKYNRALGVLYADRENINKKMLKNPYCSAY